VSILTQQGAATSVSSFGLGGHGPWSALASLAGLVMALLVGLRGRRAPLRYRQLWMVLALLIASSGAIACGNSAVAKQATPAGTYSITITATGSTGTPSSFTLPLTVN
jgi:drug/metabolite transporter (DMT)-like permease